jgi:hypothetical protein
VQASRFRLYSKGLTRRRCLGCRTVVARWYTLCGQLPVARPARPSAPRLFGVSAPQFGVGASCVAGVGCSERPASPKNFSASAMPLQVRQLLVAVLASTASAFVVSPRPTAPTLSATEVRTATPQMFLG